MDTEEDLNASNKRLLEEVEEMSVDTFATAAYSINTKKACINDNSTQHSA